MQSNFFQLINALLCRFVKKMTSQIYAVQIRGILHETWGGALWLMRSPVTTFMPHKHTLQALPVSQPLPGTTPPILQEQVRCSSEPRAQLQPPDPLGGRLLSPAFCVSWSREPQRGIGLPPPQEVNSPNIDHIPSTSVDASHKAWADGDSPVVSRHDVEGGVIRRRCRLHVPGP
jgi:hypothetical protein